LSNALYELMKRCAPGGLAERKMLLDKITRPLATDKDGNEIQLHEAAQVLFALKRWMDKVERIKEMPTVTLPDPSLLWDAVKKIITPAVEQDPDLAPHLRLNKIQT